jgi:phosphonate transport system permease protein
MVVVWAATSVDIYWPFTLDAPQQAADLIERMTPPAWGYFGEILTPLIETINIATLSTILATFLAVPVAIIGAQNLTPNTGTLALGRFIVVTSRSVNELVWGLIFVVLFGPGALAGVAALTCRSIGFTAKLIAEAIEEIDTGQVQAIEATGASRTKVFVYGILPQIMPAIFGTAVFRWDINIRQSAVIGLVGAGGIGVALNNSMNMFRWDYVTVIIMAIFFVVLASESISATLRRRVT